MRIDERAAAFDCEGDRLVGIVSLPQQPSRRGVLVVVGGPQYRAGSHRQFTLLCREVAVRGLAAMRFDYRGMGDSEGEPRTFEDIDADIHAAIDHFFATVPGLSEVVICGLCDAASATMFYARSDPRVAGIVLINPWARTTSGNARAQLRHYYGARLADKEFWQRLVRGEVAVAAALRSAAGVVRAAVGGAAVGGAAAGAASADGSARPDSSRQPDTAARPPADARPLPDRMADGLALFGGRALLVRSGKDLTAQEFTDIAEASPRWRELLGAPRLELRELPDADHTFSRREWRDQIAGWTTSWAKSW